MTVYTELKRLVDRVLTDRRFCGDENHKALADGVQALIAENERVKARLCVCRDCGGQGEVYSGHSSYQGHHQPPEPDMDVCGTCGGDGVLGSLEDFESLAAERDQLKVENGTLRGVMSAVVTEIPGTHISRAGNAPGHCHSIPGVWDRDNGAKAGKECAWCKVWNYAAAIGKGEK